MAWIKVTDPKGHTVRLCVEQLVRIRPCIAGVDFAAPAADARAQHDRRNGDMSAAQSIIDLVAGMQAVQEPQDEIIERIRTARREDDKAGV
jgi:hypothetical protein